MEIGKIRRKCDQYVKNFFLLMLNLLRLTNLIYLCVGGAPVQDIQALSIKNVNMDVTTFMNLNPAVIMV